MTSLPNEEAKIEQLIRQLATISPPFVNSREELKQLASSIYLLADQLQEESAPAESKETIIERPPLSIPAVRPIFADHSNPVPEVTEESIEAELQWKTPVPQSPATHIPPVTEPTPVQPTPAALPAVEEDIMAETPVPPNAPAPEIVTEVPPPDQEVPDLFAAADTPVQPESTPVPDNTASIITEAEAPVTRIEAPVTAPEPVTPPIIQEEPRIREIDPVDAPLVPTPVAQPEPPKPVPPVSHPTDRDLQRALPLVRRLEFINRLFNGNDSEWQLFCQHVNRCSSTPDALQIYRESYIRYGWERNADMADLLKQLIVKNFG
jgi:hypothetical protein